MNDIIIFLQKINSPAQRLQYLKKSFTTVSLTVLDLKRYRVAQHAHINFFWQIIVTVGGVTTYKLKISAQFYATFGGMTVKAKIIVGQADVCSTICL